MDRHEADTEPAEAAGFQTPSTRQTLPTSRPTPGPDRASGRALGRLRPSPTAVYHTCGIISALVSLAAPVAVWLFAGGRPTDITAPHEHWQPLAAALITMFAILTCSTLDAAGIRALRRRAVPRLPRAPRPAAAAHTDHA